MKLISKGLLISVLFVLLLVGVKAELDPVFYDTNFYNNYPYGDNSYFYQCSHGQPPPSFPWSEDCDAYYPVGSSLKENNNERRFNQKKIVGFCVDGDNDGENDCETDGNNDYWARVEFYFFNPEDRTMYLKYRVDDELFSLIRNDSAIISDAHYSISNEWQYLSIFIPKGWISWNIWFKEHANGDQDFLHVFPIDGPGPNAKDVNYFYKMTAVTSSRNLDSIKQKIHLDEGSVAGDCKDFIDNDGDWNLDGDFSNDGAAAFDFNQEIYGKDPPQGRGYKILNDNYPQFGELNVDCFDQGCEGQDGPYDWNGKLGKCNYQTEKIEYCNDGYDNDFDGLTDLDDPDCTSFCQGRDLNLDVISSLGNQYNPPASDGSDGCCGDDICIFNPDYCTSKTTIPECLTAEGCYWSSNGVGECLPKSNAQIQCTDSSTGNPLTYSECVLNPKCMLGGDYGYVTPDNQYLCYNNRTNFNGGTEDKWMWIYAPEKPFTITPLNFSGKIVDYISNSENWYYCDANPTPGLKGLPVVEYGSFPGSEFQGLTMTCSVAASYLMKSPYFDCGEYPNPDCCFDNEGSFNLINEPGKLRECRCITDDTNGETLDFCDVEEHKELDICKGFSFTKEKILTEYCAQNPRNCIDLDYYDTSKPCNQQPFDSGHTCLADQVCSNGLMLPVQDGEICCIGTSPETECIDKSQITNEEICRNSGGTPYIPSNTTFCVPEEQAVLIGPSEGCCFGAILQTDKFPWSSFEDRNNNTFSCFAYQGNSLFGQCCYGECNSLTLFTNTFVDATRNRAFSIKLPYNIQNSYDILNTTSRILQDKSLRTTEINHVFDEIAAFKGKRNISMAYYDNLEFDIIYNQISNVQKIFINDIDYGSVTQYVNNGDRRGIAHHVKIPLRPESKMQQLKQIKLTTSPQNVKLLYDNIYFSINADTVESSLNYYCAGGFASWIKDMDPPVNTPLESDFFVGENAWMEGYGRYAEVCRTYLPYGWTGHYCCGDDTNGTNYGEHYEDFPSPTGLSPGGCFNGSKVINTETVWKVKGYVEDNAYFFSKDDELKVYAYSDLIYYNNSFIGCQVPEGKYSNLRISIDGNNPSPTNNQLVNDTVSSQCVVIGTYYCMNGIWRQYIPGIGQEYIGANNIYTPSIPSELHLKSIPPGAELIKNGDFGGECPLEICNYQQ